MNPATVENLGYYRDGLRALSIAELLALDLPAREYVLRPIIPNRGLAMLYAPRGAGKTFLALSLGVAVASADKALRWTADAPRRVLYIDGEMPLETLQQRLSLVIAGSNATLDPANFTLLAADHQEFGLPDLSSTDGQSQIEPFLNGVDLLILDNLSTLVRAGRENESESWIVVQEWFLRLRRRGIAVLMVHHAGKGGNQRGTSKREDVLDTVIALRRPGNYDPSQGARFEVHLEKARGLAGDEAKAFEATLEVTEERAMWTCRDLEDVKLRQAADLFRDGLSVREVAAEMEISKSAAHRLKDKGKAEGLIDA